MPHQPAADYVDHMAEVLSDVVAPDRLEAKSLAYRLRRITHWLETELKRELGRHGIELWELELLACLRRAPGRQLTAGELTGHMQLTSGAVTNRVSRLEAKGLVTRDFAPGDRRSVLVTLTAAGDARAQEVFATKTEAELRLLAPLSTEAQRKVNAELRAVLLALESGDGQ